MRESLTFRVWIIRSIEREPDVQSWLDGVGIGQVGAIDSLGNG
jgi:hypothetical protein